MGDLNGVTVVSSASRVANVFAWHVTPVPGVQVSSDWHVTPVPGVRVSSDCSDLTCAFRGHSWSICVLTQRSADLAHGTAGQTLLPDHTYKKGSNVVQKWSGLPN